MGRVLRWLAIASLALALALAAVWVFGPREPRGVDLSFDETRLDIGIDVYLAAEEARFDDIVPGTEKRVIWAGAPGDRAAWSVVYIHGFSATSEEVRPLPDRVAAALGATLFFTRLAGHGRDGAAMSEPRLADWTRDLAEALAIGRATGERVLVIATSTGATLATIAAADPDVARGLAGLVMISPNFGLRSPAARILTWPGVRWWGPLVAGPERSFEPENADHARYWTTRYPTVSVLPMAASVAVARGLDHGRIGVPALFLYSDADRVVDPAETARVAAAWGAPAETVRVEVPPGDDGFAHVIAGDILSPRLTGPLTRRVLDWVAGL